MVTVTGWGVNLNYYYHYYLKVYILRTQLTSIFEGQPSKTRPFPIKTRGHLGSRYIYIKHVYIYICISISISISISIYIYTVYIYWDSPKLESELEPLNYIVSSLQLEIYPTNLWGFVLSMIVITICMIPDSFWSQWKNARYLISTWLV